MTQFGSFLPEDQFETPQETQFGEYSLAPDETAMTNAGSYGFDPMTEPVPQQEDMARLEATRFPQAQISMPGLMPQDEFERFRQSMQPQEQTFEPSRDQGLMEEEQWRAGATGPMADLIRDSSVEELWDQATGADRQRQEEAARRQVIARGGYTGEELEEMIPRQTMTQAIEGMQGMESMQGVVRGSLYGIPLGYRNDPEAERVMERRNVARAMRTGKPLPELVNYFNEEKFPGQNDGFFKQAIERFSRGGMSVLALPERLFVDMPAGSIAYFTDNQYGADRLRVAAENARFIQTIAKDVRNNGFVTELTLSAIETAPQLIAQFGAAALTGGGSAALQIAAYSAMGAGQAATSQFAESLQTNMAAGMSATAAAANANRDAATAFASTFVTEAIVGKVLRPFGIGVRTNEMTSKAIRRAAGMTTAQAIMRGAVRGKVGEGLQEFADQAVTDFAVNLYRLNQKEFEEFYKQNPNWVSDVFKNAAYAGLVGAVVGAPAGAITNVSMRNSAARTVAEFDRIKGRLPENSTVRRLMEQDDLTVEDVDTVMRFVVKAHAKLAIDNATDNTQMRKLGAALNMDGIEDNVLTDIINKGNNDGSVTATLRGQTRGVGKFGNMQFVVTPAMAADELVRRNLASGSTIEQGPDGVSTVVISSEGTLAFREGDETTQDAVDRFVNENPVLASRLANMESISRKMAESLQGPQQRAGAPGAFDLSSMQQRQELLEQIRDAVNRQQAEMDPRRLQERIDKQRRGAEAEIIAELNGLNPEEVARVAAGVSPRKARVISQLMQQIEQEAAQPVSANLTAEQRIRQMEDRQFAEAIRAREPGRAATAAERAQATPEAISARRARNAEAAVKEKFNRDMDAAVETAWQSRQREVYESAWSEYSTNVGDPSEQEILDLMTALELPRFMRNVDTNNADRDALIKKMRAMGATSEDVADVREAARRRAKQLEEDFRKTSREEAISILDEAEQQAKQSDPNYIVGMPDAVKMLIEEANFDMLQDIANVIADGKSLGIMLGSAVQSAEGVEMPDAMGGADIESAEGRIRAAIDNIRRTRSAVSREPSRVPGIQEVRAERDAILFEEQQKVESEMADLRKQKALAENERQPLLEEAWMTKPKGKKPPQRRKKRAPMTPEEQKIVDRIRQIDERLAELEKDQARILEQRGIVSQTMPEPEAVDATSTFPDQDTSAKRRKIEEARQEIADMNDIPADQVEMRYADGRTTLSKQEQRFANFGKKLGITVVFVKTPGRTRTAGAHKAGVVFLSAEDIDRPSDMFAIAIHETIHYLHHSNPELFKGLYSLLNRKMPSALRELRKTYTRRLDMYARMNAVRRAGLIMLNDENETSRDAILWVARNEQSPEADILRANMPDQLAAALDDQDLGSLAEPADDTISTYRKAFKQRVASGMRAPLSESQLQQEEIANLAQMLMDGAYTTIVGEDGKINLEELRRLADTKPAIGRLSALASAIMDAFQAIPGVPKKARGLNDAQLALLRQFAENPGELASPRKRNAAQQLIAKALVQMMDARRGKIAAGGIDANPMPDSIAKARIPALDFALRAEEQEPVDFAIRVPSQAFEQRFANSKVRDKDGNLMPMFHGSPKTGFNVFRVDGVGAYGPGAYFSSDARNTASGYAETTSLPNQSGIYPVFLNITNPLYSNRRINLELWKTNPLIKEFGLENKLQPRMSQFAAWNMMLNQLYLAGKDNPEASSRFMDENDIQLEIRQSFMDMGFDGIIIPKGSLEFEGAEETWAVAWRENQIKSAFNFVPSDDPRIDFALKVGDIINEDGIDYRVEKAETTTEAFRRLRTDSWNDGAFSAAKQLAKLIVGTPQAQSIPVYTLSHTQGQKVLRAFHRGQNGNNPGVYLDINNDLDMFNHEMMHGLTVNLIEAEIDALNRYEQLSGLPITDFSAASGWKYGQAIADLAKFTTNPALKELLWIYYGLGPGNWYLRSWRSVPSADADKMFGRPAAWAYNGIAASIQHGFAPDMDVAYGLANVFEFIAQLANSQKFRAWLAGKTVEDVQSGLTGGGMTSSPWVPNPQIKADSILSRLYTAIKSLLGDLLSGFNVAGTGLPADSVLPLVATAIDQFAGISEKSLLETLSAGQREAHIADNAVVPNLVGEAANARRQAIEFALRPVPKEVRVAAGVKPAIKLAGSRKFATIRDFKVALQENLREVAKKAGVTVHDRDNTAIDDYIRAVAVSDAKVALGMKNNAVGWYDEKVKKALAIMALVYPELKADKRAQFVMKMALAITSNQLEVTDNFNLAARAYEAYKQTGKLPTDIGQGNSKKVMNESLGRLNKMIDKHGLDWVMEFSNTMYTVKQIKAMTGKQVSGESVDQMVYGAAIFGPKIGNGFFANLNGKYEQLTMDRWFMRTWGRWTGMLIENNPELVSSQREEMRKTFAKLAKSNRRLLNYVGSQIGEDLVEFASTKMSNERISEIAQKIARRSSNEEFREAIADTPIDILRKQSRAHAKAIDGSIEAPKSPSMRNRIRRVMNAVLVELQKDNPELTMADLQAVYWYPEKRLYDAAKVSENSSMEYDQSGLPDYEQAAIQFAKSRNISEKRINGAIKRVDGERSVVAAQRAARGRRTAARRGGAGAVGPERQGGPDSVSFSLRDDPSTYEPADAAEADNVVNMAIRSGGVRTEVEDRLGALGRAWMGTARQLSSRLNPRNVAVEESDDIEIVTQPADISPFWKFIAAPINLAIGSKNPEVISVVEDMINMDIERNLTTKSRQEEANAVWESIPPDERDSEEFSRYMDAYHPPETIDDNKEFASKSQAWRNALKWFKEREEIRRQEIIETKRESIAGMLKRDNSTRLVDRASQYGMKWEVVRNEAGRKMIQTDDGMVTIQQARDMLVKKMIPDNWGRQYAHFFHWFNGDFKLVGYDADNNRTIIGSAITEPEAYEKLYAFKRANPGVYKKLVAEPAVRIDPDDAVRLSDAQRRRLEKMLADATGAYRDEVADAMRGIVGSKTSKRPFYAPLMERTGAGGYVTDFPTVWNMSERLHNRWRMGGDMVRQLTPRIESIRRKTPGWGDYLAESMRHTLFTAPTMTEAAVDSMIRAIPVFGKVVSPFPTRRWLGSIRALNYARQLLTVRQQVVNSFQPLQTIYPLIGEKGLMEAVAFYNSEEGKAVLRKHGFFDGSARFREGDERVLGADIMDFVSTMNNKIYKQTNENFNPSSEARNQNFAFVAMYHHAKYRMGMEDAEAVRYGRVYGNVYTQFYYTKANIPWLLRGPIASTTLQYRRFAINSTGLLVNEFQKGNYSGVARYMATMSMLGGLQASIGLSAASLIRSLYLGDKEGADDLNYKLRAWLKSELGSERMADIAMMGLPAALGIDLSGSISIWQKPFGRNIYEKIGATVAGPTVNTAIQLMTNLTAETAVPMGAGERLSRGLLDSSPAAQQIVSLWKLFSGSNEEYDAKGRLKYKLDPQDQFLRTMAFRTVSESVWAMEYQRLRIIRNEVDRYANEAATYLAGGDAANAQKVLREFNSMYPMATMTMKDISRRAKNKLQSRQMPQLTRRIDVESGVVARRIADAEGLGE